MWFCPATLPTLSPLFFAARVVYQPCLATSELKVAFAFPTDCLTTSPILLLLLVHQGQIVRRPCKLAKRWTTATTRHCLMFALPYCIDPASTVHCIFSCCIEIWRPTYKLTRRRSASATPPPLWCASYQAIPMQLGCTFFLIEIFPPCKLTSRLTKTVDPVTFWCLYYQAK
jgi:hypothetical protein